MSTLDLSKVFGPSATKIHRRTILGRADNLTKKKKKKKREEEEYTFFRGNNFTFNFPPPNLVKINN